MSTVYLSRRNLLVLLSKLDRKAAGDATACTIIKYRQPGGDDVPFNQTEDTVAVTAVDDDEYYRSQSRGAGQMHPADVPLTQPKVTHDA